MSVSFADASLPHRRTGAVWPWTLLALLWLGCTIGLRPLSLPEEGRYVGVAWEMLRSGDWLVPTQNGLPFLHKPPLFYWLTATALAVFGPHPWAARLVPLAAALIGGAVLVRLQRRHAGDGAARWTYVALLSMPGFFAAAQFANLDLLVAACIAVSIGLGGDAALRIGRAEPHRAVLVAAWVAAGIGVLAKGLIGIVLPGLVLLVWLVATRQWRLVPRLLSPWGLAAMALVVVPWFVLVEQRLPGFAHYFFVVQHFERYASTGFNNVQPWWFFIAVVPVVTLPWCVWAAATLRRAPGGATSTTDAAGAWRWLMWTWIAVVVAFFSLPQSKPVGYVMPVLFPVAALAGMALARRARNGAAFASLALAVLVCVVAIVVAVRSESRRDNVAIAQALRDARSPGDPVVFYGDFYFDLPIHARLEAPVVVASRWDDPDIGRSDNWKRELSEAAPFDRATADRVLLDKKHALALRCGSRPLWVFAEDDGNRELAATPGARRLAESHRVSLWRLDATGCAPNAAPA